MSKQLPPKPENSLLWVQAVEHWLHHIEHGYVEHVLLHALQLCHGDIERTIDTLIGNYSLGNYGNFSPTELAIDVGGALRAKDFIQVFWGNTKVFEISLEEVLAYLKNGKKHDSQLELL